MLYEVKQESVSPLAMEESPGYLKYLIQLGEDTPEDQKKRPALPVTTSAETKKKAKKAKSDKNS